MSVHYDFDEPVQRVGSGSVKWDTRQTRYGNDTVIPLGIADMDFRSPEPVIEAVRRRAEHGVFGYTLRPGEYFEAITGWLAERHSWQIKADWICHAPGVIPALGIIVRTFTEPHDRILVQPPVYPPFFQVIRSAGRCVVDSPLLVRDGRYEMDFADLEEKLSSVRMMILCNPHNPVGRVWTREELERLGDLCVRHNVIVVADEIHGDITYSPAMFTPFASLGVPVAELSFTCESPSKTFNLAGLRTAAVVVPNTRYRERYKQAVRELSLDSANPFGVAAWIAAFGKGAEWLDQLIPYLRGNWGLIESFVQERLPELSVFRPEGTYLAWIDCRSLGLSESGLDHLFRHEAGVGLEEGRQFGQGGEGFMRLNFGCPRGMLTEGLERIERAISRRRR